MDIQNSRSKELLEKVYNHLDSIELKHLSMSELKDYLEVVQKGQFLESFGKVPQYGLGMCAAHFNGDGKPADREDTGDTGDKKQ